MQNELNVISNKELLEGLKNPEKAQEIIEHVQSSLTVIVESFNTMKAEVAAINITCDKYKKLAEDNAKAAIDLTKSIKQIHIALNAHRDVLPQELLNLADELGKFVLSSSAIKAGVISNVNDKG